MSWEKFKEKGKELGYIDLGDYIKKYNDRTQYMIAFNKDGEVEIDDFVVVVINDYNKMVLMMQALE